MSLATLPAKRIASHSSWICNTSSTATASASARRAASHFTSSVKRDLLELAGAGERIGHDLAHDGVKRRRGAARAAADGVVALGGPAQIAAAVVERLAVDVVDDMGE